MKKIFSIVCLTLSLICLSVNAASYDVLPLAECSGWQLWEVKVSAGESRTTRTDFILRPYSDANGSAIRDRKAELKSYNDLDIYSAPVSDMGQLVISRSFEMVSMGKGDFVFRAHYEDGQIHSKPTICTKL